MRTTFKLSRYQQFLDTPGANPKIIEYPEETEVKIISTTEEGPYPVLMNDGTIYSVNGKNPAGLSLIIEHSPENPLYSGRMVEDKTFALRFSNFLRDIDVSDLAGEEELEYLRTVSEKLLQWQIHTVREEDEIKYLENNGIKIKKD